MAHLRRAEAAWDMHDALIEEDALGALGVALSALEPAATAVAPFDVGCDRLTAGRHVAEHYGDALRCLQQPSTRARFLAKNDETALTHVEQVAACGVTRALADGCKVINQIAMANCNESLAGFMERMLSQGRLQSDAPNVAAFHETRAWKNHRSVVEACAPVAAQIRVVAENTGKSVTDVTHAAWLPWLAHSQGALMGSVADISPMVQEAVGAVTEPDEASP